MKNAYVGRTFIQPSQTIRQLGIRLKLNPLREVIRGQRLVVVDDSIVRGNTQRALIRMLREAGAAEVHVRISSPPVTWPCFYGIDFATRAELIANGLRSRRCGPASAPTPSATSRCDGMVGATEQPLERLCTACFTGEYPIPLPDAEVGKHSLEPGQSTDQLQLDLTGRLTGRPGRGRTPSEDVTLHLDVDGVPAGVGGGPPTR